MFESKNSGLAACGIAKLYLANGVAVLTSPRLRGEVGDEAIAKSPGEGEPPRDRICRESALTRSQPDSASALPGARDLSPQAGRGKEEHRCLTFVSMAPRSRIALHSIRATLPAPRGSASQKANPEENAMKRLMILNGPNLNLLGVREPHIYGTTTLAQIKENCEKAAAQLGLALSFHQSNHEGELVDLIQSARQSADAIIINPAGYSFTSIAILDAIKAFEGPVIEVHISNIHARDEHHRHSKISSVATAVICGLGPQGYIAAMHALPAMAKKV
jgi:3-dehydroquinate dehydratase II